MYVAPELELTQMPPPWELTFMAPEGTVQVSKGGKQPTFLLDHDTYEPQQWSSWCHMPKDTIAACIPWWEPAAPSFVLWDANIQRIHGWWQNLLCWFLQYLFNNLNLSVSEWKLETYFSHKQPWVICLVCAVGAENGCLECVGTAPGDCGWWLSQETQW